MGYSNNDELEYAGFWIRVGATLIDIILLIMITFPILIWGYGFEYFQSEKYIEGPLDFLISWIFPLIGTIIFWTSKAGTPGKLVLGLRVVDAKSGNHITTMQAVGRYFAYFPASMALGMGIFWVGWDSKKQGWHDKLANTVVLKKKVHIESVHFS